MSLVDGVEWVSIKDERVTKHYGWLLLSSLLMTWLLVASGPSAGQVSIYVTAQAPREFASKWQ